MAGLVPLILFLAGCSAEPLAPRREVTTTFVGGGTLTFGYDFAALSPDRLVMDGYEHQRAG